MIVADDRSRADRGASTAKAQRAHNNTEDTQNANCCYCSSCNARLLFLGVDHSVILETAYEIFVPDIPGKKCLLYDMRFSSEILVVGTQPFFVFVMGTVVQTFTLSSPSPPKSFGTTLICSTSTQGKRRAESSLRRRSRVQDTGLTQECMLSYTCLLYTSPSPRDQRGSRMPSSA